MTMQGEIRPGYKQTEVGTIPDDWDVARIADVASITTGSRNTQDRIDTGIYPFFVRSQTVERINSYSFDGEAVLTAGDGVGTGKIFHYVDGKFDLHQRVYQISNFSPQLNGFFFYLYFASKFFDRIMSMTAKSSVDSVRREMIADMLTPMPPPAEQRAIAAALADADGLIAALEGMIAKKRDLKQAAMQHLLTGKTRLPGFSGEWELKRLGEVAAIRNHKINTLGADAAAFCVELEQVGQNTGQIDGHSDARSRRSVKYLFQKGDVLFGRLRPYLRKFWWANRDGVCSTEIWPLIPIGGRLVSGFLFQTIQTDAFIEAANSSYGTHMPRSDWKALTKFEFNLPTDPNEQTAIAEVLSDMDADLAALDAQVAKARAVKQGMMQELLTGKVRLV